MGIGLSNSSVGLERSCARPWPGTCCPEPLRNSVVRKAGAALALVLHAASGLHAADIPQSAGPVTGFPIPRFVSLAAERANMRVGPGRDYMIKWVYVSPGLPLEVLAEYGNWRKVRDQDGASGWVYHSLLSGRRTGTVAPWKREAVPLRAAASFDAPVVARLSPRVVVVLETCGGTWCNVSLENGQLSGHIRQAQLWGVYPGEVID